MGKRSVTAFVLVTLVAGFIAILAPAASALTSMENCFFTAINRERAAVGRKALVLKSDLTTIARDHSKKMAADGTIYHNNNLGNDISGNWYAAGENVGMGPVGSGDYKIEHRSDLQCAPIHDAFMDSPGHKANILDSDYNQVGLGVAYDSDGTVYITEDFAGRKTTTTTTTTTVHRTTTTTTVHRATQTTTTTHHVAPAAAPKPKPKPVAAQAVPMTVEMLVKMVGMDAPQTDPATGAALGI